MAVGNMRLFNQWFLSILAVSFIFFIYVFYKTSIDNTVIVIPEPSITNDYQENSFIPYRTKSDQPVKILYWHPKTSILGGEEERFHWAGVGSGDTLSLPNYYGQDIKKKCPIECIVTHSKSQLSSVDAVIFEGQAMNNQSQDGYDWARTPLPFPQKRPGQLWINFGYNHPEAIPLLKQHKYMSLFDINATYHQVENSHNIPLSLSCNWLGSEDAYLKAPPKKSSDKLVIVAVNNCHRGGARERLNYIKELSNYIPVHSYSGCLKNKELPYYIGTTPLGYEDKRDSCSHYNSDVRPTIAGSSLVKLFSEYKFVLAFETNNVTDYVTEKVSLALLGGSVPVYMGAPNVDEWLPGESSVIKVNDFKSPKELAEHLLRLNENHQEYQRLFAWKKHGISPKFREKLRRCVFEPDLECRMCQAVANLKERMVNTIHDQKKYIHENSYALSFDGSTSYVEVPDSEELRLTNTFTLSAWIYTESMDDLRIIDKNTAGRVDGYSMDILKKGARGFLRLCAANGCYMGMSPLFINTWYHVSVVFVSTSASLKKNIPAGITFYVNGELDYEIPFPVPMFGLKSVQKNDYVLRFGRSARGNNFWKGMIDDVSMWNVPLNQKQIRRLMYERLGGNEKGLVGYWSFNEGRGDVVHDVTPEGHHGQIFNTPWVMSEERELVLNQCV